MPQPTAFRRARTRRSRADPPKDFPIPIPARAGSVRRMSDDALPPATRETSTASTATKPARNLQSQASEKLAWQSGKAELSLDELYRYVIEEANRSEGWY